MNEAFRYITPITYGLIVTIWLYVFFFYLKKINFYHRKDKLLNLLLIILIIDAFRTIFEGLFFGLRNASQEEFISKEIFITLSNPQYVFLPKFITLVTGVLVLIIILNKWLPAEIKQKLAVKDLISKKNAELLNKNKELTKAKERAEKSDSLKTEFFHNLSHEIMTPMNAIVGFTEILEDPDISGEKRTNYSNIVKNSSHQLVRIIDNILEISTLETKQEILNETPFNLNNFIMELFTIFNLKCKDTTIAFSVKKGLNDKNCEITSDKTKLNKILSNLLENAFRYTNSGSIVLGYGVINSKLIFYVRDTGIGISKENQKKVFERFTQGEKGISKKYGGLGLGLSISNENAAILGGNITLESEKGKGSTFFVTIPYKPSKSVDENPSQDNQVNN